MNRAERRRAANPRRRPRPWEPPADPRNKSGDYGGVTGILDDGRVWAVHFATTAEARRFLSILGPPPATEAGLRSAARKFGRELKLD
jgi:hypothetical protein